MSMWELEALSETLVNTVGAMDLPLAEKRDLYANAFALVEAFDVSFTHFRTADLLEEAGFFLPIDAGYWPGPAAHQPELDALIAAGRRDWFMVDDKAEAYFTPPKDDRGASLWFDPTMGLWSRAVQAGLVTGHAAEAPGILPPGPAIQRFIALVASADTPDSATLKMLHGFVAYANDGTFDASDPAWIAARDTPALGAALQASHDKWIDERFDARHALPYMEGELGTFLAWWCALYEG